MASDARRRGAANSSCLFASRATTQMRPLRRNPKGRGFPGDLLCRATCPWGLPWASRRFAQLIPESRRRGHAGLIQRFRSAGDATMPPMTASSVSWRQALFNRRMLICVFSGFSSGLPLYLLISLLPAWLRSEQVDLRSIGLFALIQLPFTWKFFWAPLLDRYAWPFFCRRRAWMLVTQLLLIASIRPFG